MTQAEFVRRVVAMEDTLYRVSTTPSCPSCATGRTPFRRQ